SYHVTTNRFPSTTLFRSLLRSFVYLQGVTGGFSTPPRQILTMLISPSNRKYGYAPAGLAFYDELLRRARAVPGVEAAAVTDSLRSEEHTSELQSRFDLVC